MPSLTITITPAQWQRVKDSGAFDVRDPNTGSVVPATQASIQTWILRQVKARVQQAEFGDVSASAEESTRAAMATEGW